MNRLPQKAEIVQALSTHPLVRFKRSVRRMFIVGSFAKGEERAHSDIDVLIEVRAVPNILSAELEESYRTGLKRHFVRNRIMGKCDSVHPQWNGRRIDLYLTYDASVETRTMVQIF